MSANFYRTIYLLSEKVQREEKYFFKKKYFLFYVFFYSKNSYFLKKANFRKKEQTNLYLQTLFKDSIHLIIAIFLKQPLFKNSIGLQRTPYLQIVSF